MVRVTCWIRPHRLEPVKAAIAALGVTGMTVSDVRGCGASPEVGQWFAGEEQVIPLPLRTKIEVVLPDDMLEPAIQAIVEQARSGEPGDGKIVVERVLDAVRIRTEERGETAI